MSLLDSLQRVLRCSSAMRELDLLRNSLWYDLECLTNLLSISCSSVNDCDTFTLCMHRKDYMSLLDSLQRVAAAVV
jgi:hypothetical protein